MVKYFKITGLDNGIPIEPYGVETNGSYPHISVGLYGDKVRYYEPITKEEYRQLKNKLQKGRHKNVEKTDTYGKVYS